jgi:hypothetical protein
MEPITYAALTSILIGLVGWLLSNKDTKQGEEIKLLFKKHDDDAAALAALRIEIAKEHYLKHELDSRFQSLQDTFKDELRGLGNKFDHLTNVLIEHVRKEDARP